ncbi:hypothetical protein ACQKFM_29195 [Paenibacillus xylanexedens]|uniref:hypothetical protein n=1 Tax=Paenibacillus xylanexedens TaxID=528191 RepID=UPI003D07C946
MSKRVYKLFDGSELLVSEESIGLRQSPNALAVTVDGNYVIDDVLETVNVLLEDNEHLRDKVADPALGYGDKWKALALEARGERDRLRKTLRDALKLMDNKFYGMAHKNIVEALVQEGEGNQDG